MTDYEAKLRKTVKFAVKVKAKNENTNSSRKDLEKVIRQTTKQLLKVNYENQKANDDRQKEYAD